MLYEQDLRAHLRQRRDRLYQTEPHIFDNELGFYLDWMAQEPYLAALLAEIDTADLDFEQWEQDKRSYGWGVLRFPDTESKRAKVCLALCRQRNSCNIATHVTREGTHSSALRKFVGLFVDPLVHYLEDRIAEGSAILGILERYKHRTEWFHRQRLFDLYSADTRRGEAGLDAHLREYLVDQGVKYPFSQPRSPSGEADIVAGLDTGDPLALEVKLFLGDSSYGDAYVRKGFSQAYRYAGDYHLPAGYLVVFNLSDKLLLFETAAHRWPPSVRLADKTVFVVAIDVNPNVPSASKDRQLGRHVISEAYLRDGVRP